MTTIKAFLVANVNRVLFITQINVLIFSYYGNLCYVRRFISIRTMNLPCVI